MTSSITSVPSGRQAFSSSRSIYTIVVHRIGIVIVKEEKKKYSLSFLLLTLQIGNEVDAQIQCTERIWTERSPEARIYATIIM